MPKSLIENAKYASWKESHTFDTCKLNRKDYGQFLANYLIGEKDGFVLNLNGSWGTGKTEFLKRFYVELMERGHPTIYIDAWESDFSQEPLTVVASELLNQLERLMEGTISESALLEVKSALGKALKGTLVGLAGIASAKLLNDSSIGMEAVNKLLDEKPQNITQQLADDYQSQIKAIINTKEALGSLAESLQTVNGSSLPVIVLIDELDRCRPTYAIEMLEVIKHFFSIKNFVFVVATDTDQLCHSIRSIYGDEFDSSQYLKRFFDRKASLPAPNIEQYVQSKKINWEPYSILNLFPNVDESKTQAEMIEFNIFVLSKSYNLKIRDIDQLIDKLHSCLRSACALKDKFVKQTLNIAALIVGLIEQDRNFPSFNKRHNHNNDFTAPGDIFGLAHDLLIEKYVELCMNSITLTEINNSEYSDLVYKAPSLSYYRDLIKGAHSNEFRLFIKSLSDASFSQNHNDTKYWLWSDMKKCIELAGTIE